MKQNKNRIPIMILNSDIKLLKAGKNIHWPTRIDGKLYIIVAKYHTKWVIMSDRQTTTKRLNSSTNK